MPPATPSAPLARSRPVWPAAQRTFRISVASIPSFYLSSEQQTTLNTTLLSSGQQRATLSSGKERSEGNGRFSITLACETTRPISSIGYCKSLQLLLRESNVTSHAHLPIRIIHFPSPFHFPSASRLQTEKELPSNQPLDPLYPSFAQLLPSRPSPVDRRIDGETVHPYKSDMESTRADGWILASLDIQNSSHHR